MNLPDDPHRKPLNSFRLLGDILAAAVGIRSGRERGRDWSKVGTGTLLGAIFIFVAVGFIALRIFVHLVKSAATP
ncbi:MAG: hypothetical protein ACT4PZ_16550 [Panacagrimonas sp.]